MYREQNLFKLYSLFGGIKILFDNIIKYYKELMEIKINCNQCTNNHMLQ